MNAAESLGPGPAKKLLENGFCLIVEGMRRGHGLRMAGPDEIAEKPITKTAGCLLQALPPGLGGGRSIPLVEM